MNEHRSTRVLNGVWHIRFDPDNEGREERWQSDPALIKTQGREIEVPSCWEEVEEDYQGVAWYMLQFNAENDLEQGRRHLRFDAVNYHAEVWLNGTALGKHDGGFTPFAFDVSDVLEEEENTLVLRVLSPLITRNVTIDGIGPNEFPSWRGAVCGGIWQEVKLISTADIYISDLYAEPLVAEQNVLAHCTVQNTLLRRSQVDFRIQVALKDAAEENTETTYTLELNPGETTVQFELPVQPMHWWTPDHPTLYELTATCTSSEGGSDSVAESFGMREFTVKEGRFYLNGEEIFVKAGFWEGVYPNTPAYPPDEAFLRKELKRAKEAGFNVLRPWRHPPPPPTLEICDEMGLMIIDTPPIQCMRRWPAETPYLAQRVENEIREMVLRDRNHASVICWELFNEIARKCLERIKHSMSLRARELDPTRLIIDESGGWGQSGAHFYAPFSREPVPINEIHSYRRAPVSQESYDFYRNIGQESDRENNTVITGGESVFISEIGYGGIPDLEDNMEKYRAYGNPLSPDYGYHARLHDSLSRTLEETGLQAVFGGVGGFCRASQHLQAVGNKLQLEACRLNPLVSGYCLHAFTDGDWIIDAGVLDMWRNPKKVFETIRQVNDVTYPAVRVEPGIVKQGAVAGLTVTVVSEVDTEKAELRVEVFDKETTILDEKIECNICRGIRQVVWKEIDTKRLEYDVTARVTLDADGRNRKNTYTFSVLPKNDKTVPFTVFDPLGSLAPSLQDAGYDFEHWKQSSNHPVVVGCRDLENPEQQNSYKALMSWIENGGSGIFLDVPRVDPFSGRKPNLLVEEIFPFTLHVKPAEGLWDGVFHVVKKHPIFDGLHANCIMEQQYQNVCPRQTLMNKELGEPLAVSISWFMRDPNPDAEYDKRTHHGPEKFEWGADVLLVRHGRGRMLLSTLELMQNLRHDPVADKLLTNMISFMQSGD